MKWDKIELLDRISVHVEEWHVISEDGTKSAIGTFDGGELIKVEDENEA